MKEAVVGFIAGRDAPGTGGWGTRAALYRAARALAAEKNCRDWRRTGIKVRNRRADMRETWRP